MMQLSGTFCDFLGPVGLHLDESIDAIRKSLSDSRIKLTNNKIKDIIKVTRSSKNRGTLLKGTTKKEGLSIILHHLKQLLYH